MLRDSFFEINKFIRLDNKDRPRRRQTLTENIFEHICEIFETFFIDFLFNNTAVIWKNLEA